MRAIGGHSGFIFAKHRVLQTTGNIAASGIHIPNHLERYDIGPKETLRVLGISPSATPTALRVVQ
jgi:hypothetical protein